MWFLFDVNNLVFCSRFLGEIGWLGGSVIWFFSFRCLGRELEIGGCMCG